MDIKSKTNTGEWVGGQSMLCRYKLYIKYGIWEHNLHNEPLNMNGHIAQHRSTLISRSLRTAVPEVPLALL